ncbi:H+-ATPase G subunit-domain-containing protein [Kockiozyma suomiensis]|uniref:H+-ATPase G subunit-domain-containing protein n=1 Tax=Kockiozyma suomiensis TaxID=1337062 RepID=UPI0033436058
MSAQSSTGIQTLLEAEKEAQAIVAKARAYRTQKLKDARSEASKEISAYKASKETEFKEFEGQHSSSNSKAEEEANAGVQQELIDIKALAAKAKDSVIVELIEAVTKPTPTLHINAQ